VTGESREVYRGRIFSVEQLPGSDPPYEVVRHLGSAAVLPVTSEGEALLVEQQRPAIGGPLREIPAGILDVEAEDPLSCAARELHEETGYRHETIEFLGGCYPSPGFTDEYIHLFLARTRPEREREPEPGITLVRVPFLDLVRSARGGRVRDAKTALAALLADARHPRGWDGAVG
jgi:ADP-ribose pyrophosphatase